MAKTTKKIPLDLGSEVTRHQYLTTIDSNYYGSYDPSAVTMTIRRKMRRDPQIALGLAAKKAPIIEALTSFHVVSDNAELSALVEANLREIVRALATSSLRAYEFGHSPHEKIFERRDIQVEIDMGQGKAGTGQGKNAKRLKDVVVYRQIKDLEPWYTSYWFDKSGDFRFLKYGGADGVHVKAPKAFVYSFQKEFGNLHGNALIDNVYEPWYRHGVMEMFHLRYMEKKADEPTVVIGPGDEITEDTDGTTRTVVNSVAKEIADNMRSSSTLAMPSDRDENGNLLWDVKTLESADRSELFMAAIAYYDVKMLRGLIIPERVLTQDVAQAGTYAMAQSHTGTFLKTLRGDLEDILDQINRYIVPQLVEYNPGIAKDSTCRVEASKVALVDESLLARILERIISAEATLARAWIGHDPDAIKEGRFLALQAVDAVGALANLGVPVKPPQYNAAEVDVREPEEEKESENEEPEPKDDTGTKQSQEDLNDPYNDPRRRDFYSGLQLALDRGQEPPNAPGALVDGELESARHEIEFARRRGPKPRDKIRGPFWRPFTTWEQHAAGSLERINTELNKQRIEYRDTALSLRNEQKDLFHAHTRESFKKGNKTEAHLRKVKLDSSIVGRDVEAFRAHVLKAYELGKQTAKSELQIGRRLKRGERVLQQKQESKLDEAALAALVLYSKQWPESTWGDARKGYVQATATAYRAKKGQDNAEQETERNTEDYLASGAVLIGTMATTGFIHGLNQGRETVRGSLEGTSQAVKWAQYSALLNVTTSILGDAFDGRTIQTGDPEYTLFVPPLYENSRSLFVLVPVWAAQPPKASLPRWENIPPEVKNRTSRGNFPQVLK